MSIATNRNMNPPVALGKAPIMLIPQIANNQVRSMGQRGLACFIVCF
jgi:hypothetical protein